jgi:DNA-binding response OmpR family regulator
MRILVVEDNARLSELISEGLRAAGYLVDSASSVSDAEYLIKTFDHSLMVLDIALPDGSGRTLLRAARDRDQNIGGFGCDRDDRHELSRPNPRRRS